MEALNKQRKQERKREAEGIGATQQAKKQFTKTRRSSESQASDPLLDDNFERKLWIGLGIVKELARLIHQGVQNTSALLSEPGCEHFSDCINMANTSLLLSVPRKLERYPGCSGSGSRRAWMGAGAVRFHPEQRGKMPGEGAAPEAQVQCSMCVRARDVLRSEMERGRFTKRAVGSG